MIFNRIICFVNYYKSNRYAFCTYIILRISYLIDYQIIIRINEYYYLIDNQIIEIFVCLFHIKI